MPKETTWLYLVLFLFLLPAAIPGQSTGPPLCRFDRQHRSLLTEDTLYQRRFTEVESLLEKDARQRIISGAVAPRGEEEEILTIPVAVHVFYPPGTPEGNPARPSASQIQRAVQELNNGFRNRGAYAGGPYHSNAGIPGADTRIEFRLAADNPAGQPSNGLSFIATPLAAKPIDALVNGVEVLDSLRRLSAWPTNRYLNIYVLPKLCDLAGDCPSGFAYQAAAHGRDFDGVYVYSAVMAGEVEVLIHEVGHYLNLYHTFEENCAESDCIGGGDRVCDTPPDCILPNCAPSIGNCLQAQRQNTCHNDALIANSPFTTDVEDLYENFMDYGYWKCLNSFTPGQRDRMRAALSAYRQSLLTSSSPVADTCRIDSIALLATDSCVIPGAGAWAHVLLYVSNAPKSDTLMVNDRSFPVYQSPVFVRLPVSEGNRPLSVEAYFRKTPACRYTTPALATVPWCDVSLGERQRTAPTLTVARAGECREESSQWLPASSALHPLSDWPATCAAYAGGEQWLRVIVPPTGEVAVTVRSEHSTARPAAAIFRTRPDTLVACRTAASGGLSTLTVKGMSPGDTLAVAVWLPPGSPLSPLQVCAYLPTPPPPNDQCRGALPLLLSDDRYGQTCTATVLVDWTGAWRDAPYPCAAEDTGPDVWFYTLIPASGQLSIQPVGAGAKTTGLAAYAGCDSPSMACGQMTERGRPEIHLTGLPAGDTVFIRVWPQTAATGVVRLCATVPPSPAPNDQCTQASPLAVAADRESAVPLLIRNVVATASGRRNSCENDTADDLWYRLEVPAQGAVILEANSAVGVVSPSLAVYAGCQGAEIACRNTSGDQATLLLDNLTPGDTLLVAIWDFFGFRYGSAELRAYLPPPPLNDDCSAPFLLPVSADSTQSRLMLRKLRQATASGYQPSCGNGPAADLWYEFSAPSSGKLQLELPPADARAGISVMRSCQGAVLACLSPGERRMLTGLTPGEHLLLTAWSSVDSLALRLFAIPNCPALLISGRPPSCAEESDGAVTVLTANPVDGYSFQWSTGKTSMALNDLPAGEYRVTVTSPYQCRDTLAIVLQAPSPLSGLVRIDSYGADGDPGRIDVAGQGGTPPYRYRLNEGQPQSEGLFDDLPAGSYRVSILDANDCSWSETVLIQTLTPATTLPEAFAGVRIFPNPTSGLLQAEAALRRSMALEAELIDRYGRTLFRFSSPAGRLHLIRWNVGDIPPGVYFLRMEAAREVVTRRVMVVKG